MVYRLSDEELFYMSALIGGDNIWGLSDPFQNRTEDEIPFELLRIQEQLLNKNIIKAAADEQFFPQEELMSMLNQCMQSEKIYVYNSSLAVSEKTQLRFFEHAGSFIRYYYRTNAELSKITRELAIQEIRTMFGDADVQAGPDLSLVTSITKLRHMGSLSRKHFLYELKNCGCDDSLAALIVDGLQGQSEFCSLLAYDRKMGIEVLSGKLVTLRFANGNLIVTPDKCNIDRVCLSQLHEERLNCSLMSIFGMQMEVAAV